VLFILNSYHFTLLKTALKNPFSLNFGKSLKLAFIGATILQLKDLASSMSGGYGSILSDSFRENSPPIEAKSQA